MAATRAGYTALTPETTAFPPILGGIRGSTPPLPPPSPAVGDRRRRSTTTTGVLSSADGDDLASWLKLSRLRTCAHNVVRLRRVAWDVLRDFVDDNAGLLLVALAQFFLALVNVAVKELNVIDDPVPTLELVWVRMSITYLCSIAFMWWQKVPDPFLGPKGVRLLLVFRGFVGFFGLFGVYFSLQYLSLSDATVLTFLSPIFTGIAGALLLNEPLSRKEVLAGLCSFAGVVLIARPEFLFGHPHVSVVHALNATVLEHASNTTVLEHGAGLAHGAMALAPPPPPSERGTPTQRLVAVGVSLIGVLGATGAYTTIRAIGKRAHPLHSLAFFSSQSVVVSSIGRTSRPRRMAVMRVQIVIPRRWDWLAMLAVIGIFGFIAQVCLTMGLQREAAGRASLAIYIGIIYALALEKIFFGVSPSALSIAGMTIILSAALYIALTKESGKKKRPTPLALEDSALEEGLLSSESDDGEGEVMVMSTLGEPKSPKAEMMRELSPVREEVARHEDGDRLRVT